MPGAFVDVAQEVADEHDIDESQVSVEAPPIDDVPPREYTVFREHVSLDFDFREKTIKGCSDIYVSCKEQSISEIFVDSRQCEIDVSKITVSGCATSATYQDPYDSIDTPKSYKWTASQWHIKRHRMRRLQHRRRTELSAMSHEEEFKCTPDTESLRVLIPPIQDIQASLAKGRQGTEQPDQWDKAVDEANGSLLHKISIPFVLRNFRDGLQFVGLLEGDMRYPHVYTRHSMAPGTASALFPCIDDPACRSSWKISLTFPRTLGDAFKQPLATHQQLTNSMLNGANESRKRKRDEEEPQRQRLTLVEQDKMLEMTAVCSGKLEDDAINQDDETKKTMTFECQNKAARHIGFAIGPFEHVDLWSEFRSEEDDEKLGSNATKIHGYCLPGRAEEVRNTCAALVTAIDHFAMNYGRYPFDSYKVCFVDDMVSDTAPLCGFSLCSTRMLYPRKIIDTEVETTRTLVHALANQWFGINIVPDKKTDVWLVCGIAWFMTDLFMKALCGNNEYRFRMKAMGDKLVEIDINRPSLQSLGEHLHLGDFEMEFMDLKANLVLFILDRRLSKSSGSAGLTRIIARMIIKANTSSSGSDEILTSDMFRKACEKHGQTRLDSFWDQWIKGSGCPRFDVFQRFNKKRLCVEMTIRQTQDIAASKARPLQKSAFWREVMEENNYVYAGELQSSFTGPMTIRIHEADGTPYEHIVDIREDSGKAVKFEIPYNTKYKRLKRNRRQRERQLTGNAGKHNEEGQDDSLLYSLGDVLATSDEVAEWKLTDWDEMTENKMDQESYEWIRMDADFEWICEMKTNLAAYMYVSQLQQDRDVVAQQDTMLYMQRQSEAAAHPLISTFLTRTLVDIRYFHGIRTMAADILPRHSVNNDLVKRVGLEHLEKTFRHFFCINGTSVPRPNDFSDKRQYLVQCKIIEAIARIRDLDGRCPKEARHFLLQQLQGNDNSENCYSDQYYICILIRALATCQISEKKKTSPMSFSFGDEGEDEEMVDREPQEFLDQAMEEIERYRRMDEYAPSYQNCFTVAALDALCRLMKAKVIKENLVIFTQYLQDMTIDVVRIKGFESLVELGQLESPVFLDFLMAAIATDPSPFVRDRLFKALCRGVASIAVGDTEREAEKDRPVSNEDGLILEQDNALIENKQKELARKTDLSVALNELKAVTKDNEAMQSHVWDALSSPVLSVAELNNLVELCSILFEEKDSLVVSHQYPTYWTAEIQRDKSKSNKSLFVDFKRKMRLKPRQPYVVVAPRPEPKRTITLSIPKNPSFSAGKPPTPASAAPTSVVVKPTVLVKATASAFASEAPKEVRRDSIAVQTPRPSIEVPAAPSTPAATSERKPLPGATTPKPANLKKEASPAKPLATPARPASAAESAPPAKDLAPAKRSATAKPAAPAQAPSNPAPTTQTNKPNGARVGTPSGLAPPPPPPPPGKSLKRQSTEPADSSRPSKIVKLNVRNLPMERFQERAKIVSVKFNAWDRLTGKAKPPSTTPTPGSIRATPKGPPALDRSNSIVVQSPVLTQSPQQSTSTTQANTSFSSPPLPTSQTTSTPPSQSQASFLPGSSSNKPARKPLPGGGGGGGGERKPLPSSGGRTSLPGATPRQSSPSQAAVATPSTASAATPASASVKTKIKIKVKAPTSN